MGHSSFVVTLVVSTRGKEEKRKRGKEEQRNRGTEEQRNRGTEEQRNRGTEEQRNRGTEEKSMSRKMSKAKEERARQNKVCKQ
jgi:hypothetical protein